MVLYILHNVYSYSSLTRVRHTERQNVTTAATTLDSSRSLILFEDYAVTEEDNLNFKLMRIQRMLNKINRKRVECKEPVPFGDKCIPTLDMLCQVYQAISPGCYQISSEIVPNEVTETC